MVQLVDGLQQGFQTAVMMLEQVLLDFIRQVETKRGTVQFDDRQFVVILQRRQR